MRARPRGPVVSTDTELPFIEHLGELRTRVVRSAVIVVATTVGAWCVFPAIFAVLSRPLLAALAAGRGEFLVTGITEGFQTRLRVSLTAGLLVSLPWLLGEAWRFVSPALYARERRTVRALVLLATVLFAAGVVTAYFLTPVGVKWLLSQVPPGAVVMPSLMSSVSFVSGMMLAFGLAFEFPVVIAGLAVAGLVDRGMLLRRWRESVLIIMVAAAIITPSADAVTMAMLTVPLLVLYALSLVVTTIVGKRRVA